MEKGSPRAPLEGTQPGVAPTDGAQVEVPRKVKVPVRPRNSTPGDLSRENEDANSKRYPHPHVHRSVTDDSQGRAAAGGCPRKKETLPSTATAGSQGHHGKRQMP